MSNRIRTTVLLAVLTAFLLWVGQLMGGRQGLVIALVLAAGMNFFSYWFSHKMVLAMYRARPVTQTEAPELHEMVASLARAAELPIPTLYRIPQDAPNAFATGRNPEHAVIAVTDGLLRTMEKEEIRGVLAHEMAHIQNRDMLILAPVAAVLIQTAISRSREYLADSTASRLAGGSGGLANALEKLGAYSRRIPMQANPTTAHMFIVNPLAGGNLARLFSTHPPLEERVRRLRGHRTPGSSEPAITEKSPHAGIRQGEAFWDRLTK